MAADASARLKVEGLAELKNSMSQAKAAVKALDAELAASAAAYKAGGDAEKYQQEQAKLLNEQLEAQQRVVDAAKEAMQKMKDAGQDGTAAYYSMQTAAANAQAKLYTMRSALDNLSASSKTTANGMDDIADSAEEIGKQAGGAAGEASNLENNLSSINTNISLDKVIGGIDSITSAAKKAAKQVLEIGKDIWTTAEEAAAWADEIATSARNAGVDAETYQRWQYAAEIIDVSVDDITKAQDRLAKKREGGAKTFSIFDLGEEIDQMGRFASGLTEAEARINYFDEAGNLKSYNDILWETVSVIGKVKDENVQNTIAQGLFGKSYRELTGLFKDGALDDWNKAMEEASVLTNEQIAKQNGLSDTLALMNMSYDTAKMAIFAALAPSMQKIAEAFTDIFQSVSEWAGSESGQKAIEGFGDSIASIVTSFTAEDLTGALEKAQGFLEKVSDGFANFKDNKDAIVTGIKACFGVFAGLELAGDALKVVQFVDSVKNIFGKTASVAVSGDANVTKLATEGIGASSGLTDLVGKGIGGILGKVGSFLRYLASIAVLVAGINQRGHDDEGNQEVVIDRTGGTGDKTYEVITDWQGVGVLPRGWYEEVDQDKLDSAEYQSRMLRFMDGLGETFEEEYLAREAFYQYAENGVLPRKAVSAVFGMGDEHVVVTLDEAGVFQISDEMTDALKQMEEAEDAALEDRLENAVEEGTVKAQQRESSLKPNLPELVPYARTGGVRVYDIPVDYTVSEEVAKLAEEFWDSFRLDENDDWIEIDSILNEMLPEALYLAFDKATSELNEKDPLTEDLGDAFWENLKVDGMTIGTTVSAGIDSAIPTVAESVASLNAVISQIGQVAIGAAGGNTTNNNSTTYIENYNEASRGNYFGQGFREIAAIGG